MRAAYVEQSAGADAPADRDGIIFRWAQVVRTAIFASAQSTEEGLSAACKARGLRIAMIERPIAHYIGDKRHAHDPFQPRRATTLFSRLRRSAAKRWPIASAGERVQCR